MLELLDKRRSDLGLPKAEVVRRAFGPDASPTLWQNIQRGKAPRFDTVAALAKALGLDFHVGPAPSPTAEAR